MGKRMSKYVVEMEFVVEARSNGQAMAAALEMDMFEAVSIEAKLSE